MYANMLRRSLVALARRGHEALAAEGSPTAAWRALQQSRALHPSAATLLAEKEPPSSSSSSSSSQGPPEDPAATGPQHIPGATESVVFDSFAKLRQQRTPGGGLKGVTRFLGFSGVLPFWVFSPVVAQHLPLDLLLDPGLISNPGLLQVGYGATILSFLGGVHWGLAMTNVGGDAAYKLADQRYLWSVVPCLMGWPTVAMPLAHAAGIQAMLLGLVYFVDRAWAKKGLLPPWYIKMRLPLTTLAAAGLLLTATSG